MCALRACLLGTRKLRKTAGPKGPTAAKSNNTAPSRPPVDPAFRTDLDALYAKLATYESKLDAPPLLARRDHLQEFMGCFFGQCLGDALGYRNRVARVLRAE